MNMFQITTAHPTLLVCAMALCTSACVHDQSDSVMATAALVDNQNRPAGSVSINAMNGGIVMMVQPVGLAQGSYGMHFHQKGACDAPKFETAGSHWNPAGRQHGLANMNGPHEGDLPNIEITSTEPMVKVPLTLDLIGADKSLLDADGAAIIIHARPDDNMTDPSGNSGERILCGVLR